MAAKLRAIINLVRVPKPVTSWLVPTSRLGFGLLSLLGIMALVAIQLQLITPFWESIQKLPPVVPLLPISRRQVEIAYSLNQQRLPQSNSACRIPKLAPFHPSLTHLVQLPEKILCQNLNGWPLLFSLAPTADPVVVKVNEPEEFGFQNCCYHADPFGRDRDVTDLINSTTWRLNELDGINCQPLLENRTEIPINTEFVAVLCQPKPRVKNRVAVNELKLTVVDLFALAPPKVPKNLMTQKSDQLNIVILGIDSTSHMNFLRNMPRSYLYLTQNISAIGMQGFSSLGYNTFYNVIPMLTGLPAEEFRNICYPLPYSTPDNCDFIWNNFTDKGYLTSFAEDAPELSIFKYQLNSFTKPPVDYYFHEFASLQERRTGHVEMSSAIKMCSGPRLGFKVLLNYLKRVAISVPKNRRYFQFIWATSLFHEDFNSALAGDEHLLNTLEWFKENSYLENTAFVLMSDHGARFGEITDLEQGKLEERMPFLYMHLPKWFRDKYPIAVKNFYQNQNSLTTPFDLHETLNDLLNPSNLAEARIRSRSMNFHSTMPRGISLFLPIPSKRTCNDADIDHHFCVCFPTVKGDLKDPNLKNAAQAMIDHINKLVGAEQKCAKLELDQILHAEHRVQNVSVNATDLEKSDSKNFLDTIVTLTTRPGSAMFEGSLTKANGWKVMGSVSRTNSYKGQDFCTEDKSIKPYCFCSTN